MSSPSNQDTAAAAAAAAAAATATAPAHSAEATLSLAASAGRLAPGHTLASSSPDSAVPAAVPTGAAAAAVPTLDFWSFLFKSALYTAAPLTAIATVAYPLERLRILQATDLVTTTALAHILKIAPAPATGAAAAAAAPDAAAVAAAAAGGSPAPVSAFAKAPTAAASAAPTAAATATTTATTYLKLGVPPAHLGASAGVQTGQALLLRSALEAGCLRAAAEEPRTATLRAAFRLVWQRQGARGLWRGFPQAALQLATSLLLGAPFLLPLALLPGLRPSLSADTDTALAQAHAVVNMACIYATFPLWALGTRVAADRTTLAPRALPPLPKHIQEGYARAATSAKHKALLSSSSPALAMLRDTALFDTWRGTLRGGLASLAHMSLYTAAYAGATGMFMNLASAFVMKKYDYPNLTAEQRARLAPRPGPAMSPLERDLFHHSLAATGAAATAAGLAAYPLWTLRTAVAVAQNRGYVGLAKNGSIHANMLRMVLAQGGVRALYRGALQVPLVHAPLFVGANYALGRMGKWLWPENLPAVDVRHYTHFQTSFYTI